MLGSWMLGTGFWMLEFEIRDKCRGGWLAARDIGRQKSGSVTRHSRVDGPVPMQCSGHQFFSNKHIFSFAKASVLREFRNQLEGRESG
jgi:hypothetical protein